MYRGILFLSILVNIDIEMHSFCILEKQHNQGGGECSLIRRMIIQIQETCVL